PRGLDDAHDEVLARAFDAVRTGGLEAERVAARRKPAGGLVQAPFAARPVRFAPQAVVQLPEDAAFAVDAPRGVQEAVGEGPRRLVEREDRRGLRDLDREGQLALGRRAAERVDDDEVLAWREIAQREGEGVGRA